MHSKTSRGDEATSIETRILEARGGDAVVGSQTWDGGSVEEAARRFGLFSSPGIYFEVTAREAEAVLGAVLIEHMGWLRDFMPLKQAARLAAEFIGQFRNEPAKFYTNGEYGRPMDASGHGPSFTPATEATFDTGVLVVCPDRIACAWFMDED